MNSIATHDVAVIGAGPAGIAAATALARSLRSVVVIDSGQPRNRFAEHAHNVLGSEGASPLEIDARGRAEAVAMTVIRGEVPDPTGGATHYYATTMPRPPAWVKGATFTVQIGAHRFYRNVP